MQKNIKLIKRNFPKINNTIAVEKIIRLISLSRLVGIQLNSNPGIFTSIDLSFQNCNLKNKILFKVKKFIKKFSFCELDIEGNGIKAKIESFIIPELNNFSFKKTTSQKEEAKTQNPQKKGFKPETNTVN